jgi:hypothetical protein
MTIQRAAKRLRDLSPVALLLAALLLASGSLTAQERSRPGDSSAGSRTAEPRSSDRSPSSPPPSSPSGGGGWDSRPSDSGGDRGDRRAVPAPRDRDPNRQPPRDRGRRDGDHDYRGGYWHRGYYYDPYFYPYGYWGRFGWWWGGWWWGDSYFPYYYPHYPYEPYGRRYGDRYTLGALDLDVAPGKTEVYLDGRYIGIVDQYDGFPQYLWLDKGTYDIVFYREGYKTIARQISVYPGTVIDIDDRMEPGESVRPEDLASKSTERRDRRIREDQTRREEYERRQQESGDEEWRDRGRRRDRVDERDRDEYRDEMTTEEGRSESGWLRLEVEPDDASVYLDGRFVGTGRELAGLRRGLAVEPGDHHIAVVRPGRKPEERDFEVEAGEETELEIELETGAER